MPLRREMGLVRWWLCVLLALALLHPPCCWRCATARADGDVIGCDDGDALDFGGDMADFADDDFADDPPGQPSPGQPSPGQPSPGQPSPLGLTLGQFVDAYNAACADGVRVQGPTDRDQTVFGITYLAAGDTPGLYAQLAIDPSGQLLVAGARLDASDADPDLTGFFDVAAAAMRAVFPDLSAERRDALLRQALDSGEHTDGQCVATYVAYDDNERVILMYRVG